MIGAGILVVLTEAVVLVLGLGKLGSLATKELDVNQAQIGVQQILTDPIAGYGRSNVTDVECNNGRNPTVKSGASFTCEANINGAERRVTVVFKGDNGTYEVGRPR